VRLRGSSRVLEFGKTFLVFALHGGVRLVDGYRIASA
jgi:hypothetical protein